MLRAIFILRLFALFVVAGGAATAVLAMRNVEPRPAATAVPALPSRPTAVQPESAANAPLRVVHVGAVMPESPAQARPGPVDNPVGPTASRSESRMPGESEIVPSAATQPRAGLADLNTASQAELDMLRGGGAIGRAIVKGRPYRSSTELVSRRVLSRARFERIRDQVVVRPL